MGGNGIKAGAMKLLFFTPTVSNSAIGRMAKIVVRDLVNNGHEVTVVRSESIELMPLETHIFPCPVIAWNERKTITKTAKEADGVVYQIGDNFQLHMGCIEWLHQLPGVICLHDYFLGNLFWGWSQNRSREDINAVLKRLYGNNINGYFDYTTAEAFIEGTHRTMPMTEWVASMGQAVIVHSGWDIGRVISACSGPARVVPLAYDKPLHDASTANGEPSGDDFVVLTIGHINSNKRAESVIKAIGGSHSLRERTLYRLVGQIEQEKADNLTSLARSLGVRLQISGKVDDQTLACAISQADIVCCLRWPSLEAASASTIEAMLYAKPVIVTNTGFYSELPDDCVVKISPEHELDELKAALETLGNDPKSRQMQGQRAEEYASATFSAQQYAESLAKCCQLCVTKFDRNSTSLGGESQ
jgi:glycosyltransferase involved in cell wall biosynthesis